MTITSTTALSAVLALSLFAACSARPAATESRTPPSTSAAATPPGQASTASNVAPSGGQTVTATVLETMDASNYTYVRVQAGSREVWAAASQFPVAVGDKVVLSLEQPMENFHSQTLNRDFPLIYFVSRIAHEGDPSPPLMAVGHAAVQSPGTKSPPQAVTTVMEPVVGVTTVAEVWKTRAALAGKRVTVRGKVVKYNGGILGVNWMHLQDGTGNASDGSNDITVTSETDTKVGDVVTATGTVAVNKDLGSGYNYPVIIERAAVAKK